VTVRASGCAPPTVTSQVFQPHRQGVKKCAEGRQDAIHFLTETLDGPAMARLPSFASNGKPSPFSGLHSMRLAKGCGAFNVMNHFPERR